VVVEALVTEVLLDVEKRQVFEDFDRDLRELFLAEGQLLEFIEIDLLDVWVLSPNCLNVGLPK